MKYSINNFATTWSMFPGPCYDPQEQYGDCPPTMLDILNDERIPARDRIWAFAACTEIPENVKRMAAVRFVRETPLYDGRFVVDLLTDERSENAVDVAEKYANGNATYTELRMAGYDADAAFFEADAMDDKAACSASCVADQDIDDAVYYSAYYAANAAHFFANKIGVAGLDEARLAQAKIIKSFFKK